MYAVNAPDLGAASDGMYEMIKTEIIENMLLDLIALRVYVIQSKYC